MLIAGAMRSREPGKMDGIKACAPLAGMIFVQVVYAGSNILCKLALEQGLSYLVFIVYRHLIALLVLAPFAYALERKQRPPLSLCILCKIFVLAVVGVTAQQIMYYAGLDYTSPTVASALSNVIPAQTFILAIILRMEKLSVSSNKGKARLVGTMLCIGGALIFTFYKGRLMGSFMSRPLIRVHGEGPGTGHAKDKWFKGLALVLGGNVCFSAWLILQGLVSRVYPAMLSMNALMCLFGALQSSAFALIFERRASPWRMGWNMQLLATVYCGIMLSCVVYYLQTYCIMKKGPVFAAMFTPLVLVIIAIFSAIFFAEQLHLGSLIGALVIIVGLYIVLWGKAGDSREDDRTKLGAEKCCVGTSSDATMPRNAACHPV